MKRKFEMLFKAQVQINENALSPFSVQQHPFAQITASQKGIICIVLL